MPKPITLTVESLREQLRTADLRRVHMVPLADALRTTPRRLYIHLRNRGTGLRELVREERRRRFTAWRAAKGTPDELHEMLDFNEAHETRRWVRQNSNLSMREWRRLHEVSR